MNRRMLRFSDPYIAGFMFFCISLTILTVLPASTLGYVLLGVWILSIFLIGWGMGHKAKERKERGGFFF